MFDINFYIKSYEIIQKISQGEKYEREEIFNLFESFRSKEPTIYNIETTNACNMRCKMCPRTTRMTRPVKFIKKEMFKNIIDQIRPWTQEEWKAWKMFVEKAYNIKENDMSENHFFLYIIPDVIQLHGYGAPLLDKNIAEYVKILNKKGFKSYFSCNPANIKIDLTTELFYNGLDYIKYSIESVDDTVHKEIRGDASNFKEGYEKILKLLDIKKQKKLQTTVIITMLDLNRADQIEEYNRLKKMFKDKDVYIYLKSEDQQWYRKDYHGTNSIHWAEICKHPWMSMTIKSDGAVAMCMEDYNNEIILGHAENNLYDIWNGKLYEQFRRDHFSNISGIKCTEECDMPVIGSFFNEKK